MRYNGQLHRTPRYSRVPARDDHGASRCVGRDGRMRPTVQRVLGASDAAAARPARTHASRATRVAPSVAPYGMRVASGPFFGWKARGFDAPARRRDRCAVDPVRHAQTHASSATRVAPSVRHARRTRSILSEEGRAAPASRHAPNGDLRRRPPFHAARCRGGTRGICNIRGCRQPKTPFFCYYFSSRSKIVIFILEFSLQKLVIS